MRLILLQSVDAVLAANEGSLRPGPHLRLRSAVTFDKARGIPLHLPVTIERGGTNETEKKDLRHETKHGRLTVWIMPLR